MASINVMEWPTLMILLLMFYIIIDMIRWYSHSVFSMTASILLFHWYSVKWRWPTVFRCVYSWPVNVSGYGLSLKPCVTVPHAWEENMSVSFWNHFSSDTCSLYGLQLWLLLCVPTVSIHDIRDTDEHWLFIPWHSFSILMTYYIETIDYSLSQWYSEMIEMIEILMKKCWAWLVTGIQETFWPAGGYSDTWWWSGWWLSVMILTSLIPSIPVEMIHSHPFWLSIPFCWWW